MSSEYRIKLKKLFSIIISWTFICIIITCYDHLVLYSIYAAGPAADYSFGKSLLLHLGGGVTGSLLGGTFLVFYINDKYRDKPYWQSIAAAISGFLLIVAIVTLLLGLATTGLLTGGSFSNRVAVEAFENFVLSTAHLKNALVWGIVVVLTQFTLQVNNKFGQGTLWNFIKGKYHFPQKEKRIFMFVDIQSSTSIAESLGNERYHHLLKDFFADITDAIIYNKGEIYQYVGDQVVITWKMKNGVDQSQCIKCYFDMRQAMQQKESRYQEKYGLVPDFKAGIHFGDVIAGEIGIVKKDITFSGDVLNTAARLQGKCNEYGVHILSSDELLSVLPDEGLFKRISIGEIRFRGKAEKMAISTLQLR